MNFLKLTNSVLKTTAFRWAVVVCNMIGSISSASVSCAAEFVSEQLGIFKLAGFIHFGVESYLFDMANRCFVGAERVEGTLITLSRYIPAMRTCFNPETKMTHERYVTIFVGDI